MENIDIEARLFNIDHKQKKEGCGGKEFKSNNLDKNSCYKFNEENISIPLKTLKMKDQIISVINTLVI